MGLRRSKRMIRCCLFKEKTNLQAMGLTRSAPFLLLEMYIYFKKNSRDEIVMRGKWGSYYTLAPLGMMVNQSLPRRALARPLRKPVTWSNLCPYAGVPSLWMWYSLSPSRTL